MRIKIIDANIRSQNFDPFCEKKIIHFIPEKYEKNQFDPLETPWPFHFKNTNTSCDSHAKKSLWSTQKDSKRCFDPILKVFVLRYMQNLPKMDQKYISAVLKWSNHYFSQRSYRKWIKIFVQYFNFYPCLISLPFYRQPWRKLSLETFSLISDSPAESGSVKSSKKTKST